MESQNHFYGHSAAFAVYAGRPRPRHIHGLVQHGWTAVSPVQTHFRDFPKVGLDPRSRRRLLVWSHESRGWDPEAERHTTTPLGAQFAYLARAAGETPEPRDGRDEVVLMPVHGIQTQRVRGDHAGLARLWRDQEGPATACLYAADAADPEILGAYTGAGHRVVVLGERMDAEFLWRLWTMLGRARRVVSNRLSTPVLYGAHLGAEVGVYGDALRFDGESADLVERVRQTWPELHGQHLDPAVTRPLVDQELGLQHLLSPQDLEAVLGWRGLESVGPAAEFWTTSVAARALVNLRRRADAPPPAAGSSDEEAPAGLALGPWLRAAMSYLPRPLPRDLPAAGQLVEPIEVR